MSTPRQNKGRGSQGPRGRKTTGSSRRSGRSQYGERRDGGNKSYRPFQIKKKESKPPKYNDSGLIRLNKYISNAGVCSRREADTLIESGIIKVNGKVVTEVGTKVKLTDTVKYGDQTLRLEKMVYLLLNKPKDYITSTDQPKTRKTVMQLVSGATKEKIVPVGKLDGSTTGLLLLTNDADLSKILTHPSHKAKKIYHVFTDQNVTKPHLNKMMKGVEVDGKTVKVEVASFVKEDRKQVGIEITSSKHNTVQKMFESFGYKIKKIDRVFYAGLTKKDLPRGAWRILSDKEVVLLKRLVNQG